MLNVQNKNSSYFVEEVRGTNPGMKKWRRGNGTIFTANFLKSAFSCPGNLRHVVTPDIVAETRWFWPWFFQEIWILYNIGHFIPLARQNLSGNIL
jgi:hypothetical protein